MKHVCLLSLLLAATLFNACKKDKDEDPEPAVQTIIPGVGLSDLKIGDPAQKAIDLFGSVAPSYGASSGQYTHFLAYFAKGVIVSCEPTPEAVFNAQMKIDNIALSSPFSAKTDKQIGIGSTKDAVKAAYGEPDFSSMFFGDVYNIGITFVYDGAGTKVEEIIVE